LNTETVPLHLAVNRATAKTIYSGIHLPGFDQSSMDGFAVCTGTRDLESFRIVGEVQAGNTQQPVLNQGEAMRIFTGAALPENTSGIVIQEKATVNGNSLTFTDPILPGRYIRTKGSQLAKGELAVEADTQLKPATIGLIASLGITEVEVYKSPKVALTITGNELVQPGNQLEFGQIYESNSYSLMAALQQLNIRPVSVLHAKDNLSEIKACIHRQLDGTDILVISGGISVGKYDLVYEALQESGAETLFYKVAQKPGKPMFAGVLNNKLIIALPGNPAAVLVGFYEYLLPVIRSMSGIWPYELPAFSLKITCDLLNQEDRALFVRAVFTGDFVTPLEKQDSNMLHSFSLANCLIYIPRTTRSVANGELVEIHALPDGY
jgi:molybdopterin molybdotransferase